VKTRLWVMQGRLGEALGWARARELSVDDELSYLREFEHITLARVLLAQYKHDHAGPLLAAMGLLARLLQAAEAGGRTGSVIEILLLQALAYQMQGDLSAALVSLERALTLAEPEGYVRIFVDGGPPMRLMILDFRSFQDKLWIAQPPDVVIVQNRQLTIYADKILAGFGNEPPSVDTPLADEQPKIQSLSWKDHKSQIRGRRSPVNS
jgi:hypothetical protein